MSSTASTCGLSRRLGGSHCQGSSGKWDVRSQFSPVPLPRGWTSPTGALVVGPTTAGAGWNHSRAVAISAQSSGCHQGISLGVLPSLLCTSREQKLFRARGLIIIPCFSAGVLPLSLGELKSRDF